MDVDPLDVAYIALGAKQALSESNVPFDSTSFEGELDYISTCIDQAGLVERAWTVCENTFAGVWCYDVSRPFGVKYGKHLLAGGSREDAVHILRELVVSQIKNQIK